MFHPDLMNYAALGNVAHHLHVHFIPRYQQQRQFQGVKFKDQRWGKNYAPYDYNFKTDRSVLMKIKEAIKERL